MSNDPEMEAIFKNPGVLNQLVRKRNRNRSPPNEKAINEDQKEIFNTSPNAQEELRQKYMRRITDELDEHDKARKEAKKRQKNISPMIPIPPPNPRGGVKKGRRTKRRRSMIKKKRSTKKKVKRKTNKKRINKKSRKTRRH
jgi:hypothetical protein